MFAQNAKNKWNELNMIDAIAPAHKNSDTILFVGVIGYRAESNVAECYK